MEQHMKASQSQQKFASSRICFGEYVSNVGFSANMLDRNSTIGNPFTSCILAIFNVVISFGGHIVTPLDSCIIVVVESSGIGGGADRLPKGGEMGCHIVGIDR
jgi:hypothetical protein